MSVRASKEAFFVGAAVLYGHEFAFWLGGVLWSPRQNCFRALATFFINNKVINNKVTATTAAH